MSEPQEIDAYLFRELSPADALVMEARLLVNKELKEKANWQRFTHDVIKHYSRNQLKAELEEVHQKLFTEKRFKSFRQTISTIFKNI